MFRVLLPVDANTDRALRAAEAVTSLPISPENIAITVLNVQKKVTVQDSEGNVSSDEWYDEADFPDSVDAVADELEAHGVAVETRREHARPAEAIVEVAAEMDADRIVVSGRKRSPVGKVLFGSTTQSVLLDAETPVTVVPGDD